MIFHIKRTAVVFAVAVTLSSCAPDTDSTSSLNYEKYELDNGLDVVLHVDRSDPIAAVVLTFHVGSAREVEGKTGFAHLFEHLYFLDSENLGPGGLDKLMTRIGSNANGSTTRDRTNYHEVVPIDGLEKTLWAEADKVGYFINTVTEEVVSKEKQIVKNEKRQGVDNRPYGHESFVIDEGLYPQGHPYHWQVIGSLDDLDSATLADVKEFHGRWYGPNNATLVVAGDLDIAQTKEWIKKYFGEIPAVEMPESQQAASVSLQESTLLFHEDNFARLPRLTLSWPTVPEYHPDSYALDVLTQLLVDGKRTPFYEVLVKMEELAPSVNARTRHSELAGQFTLSVTAFADTDLNTVRSAVERAFDRFENEGIDETELEKIKAGVETSYFQSLASVRTKAFRLANYNIFAGSAGFAEEDLDRLLNVTAADVNRVYEEYIKAQPFVATSFVPSGKSELALTGSERAHVVEETIVQGAEAEFSVDRSDDIPRTPSEFDRTVEPLTGQLPSLSAPTVWNETLPNGLKVFGIETRETPMVEFELRIKGGLLLESRDRIGVGNLLAESMMEGTADKTPEDLELAIDLLGASIRVSMARESMVIRGATLSRNYAATMSLVEEILLEPRFDVEAFELARQRVRNRLRQLAAIPASVAQDRFNELLYDGHILGANARGTVESVESIQIEDLVAYHDTNLRPNVASFHIAGAISSAEVIHSLNGIAENWEPREIVFPEVPEWNPETAGLYFVDIPGAKQSVLQIGYLALAESDLSFYPATVMNFRLGGGGFASDLTQVLREGKGYTYGISSSFRGSDVPGPFLIGSSIRSNVTFESLYLVKDIVERHGPEFDEEDLAATKDFLLRSNAMAFEGNGRKLSILAKMSAYGFPSDYVLQRESIVRDMTVEEVANLAEQFLDPSQMLWLVVGDAESQLERLGDLGLGQPTVLKR